MRLPFRHPGPRLVGAPNIEKNPAGGGTSPEFTVTHTISDRIASLPTLPHRGKHMQIAEALGEFLSEQIARGSRPKTVRYYRKTLDIVLRPYMEQPLDCLTVFIVNKAMQAVAERGLKPATLASYDRALRGFCSWLVGVDLLAKNPMQNRKRPKLRWQPKQTIAGAEIQRLFAVAKADARYRERHIAILYLLLSCGLRAGEVAALHLSDIDWEQGILRVDGKTGYGQVPIDRQTLLALRRYITHSRKATSQVSQVFVFNRRPISAETVSRLVARLGRRAGIDRPIGPHICRHTFATAFVESGGDVFSLKRVLRHTTLHTSMQYVHSSTASLRGQMENGNPTKGLRL